MINILILLFGLFMLVAGLRLDEPLLIGPGCGMPDNAPRKSIWRVDSEGILIAFVTLSPEKEADDASSN